MVEPDRELATILRRLREERGITREALAFRSGVTVSALFRIERGKVAPGWGTVRLLAKGLGITMVELSAAVEGTPRPACPASGRRSHFIRR